MDRTKSTIQYEAVEFMGWMLDAVRKDMVFGMVFESIRRYQNNAWFRLLLSVSKYIDSVHENQRIARPSDQIPFNVKKWKATIEEDLECALYTLSPYHDFLVSGEIRNGISNLLWRIRECIQYCESGIFDDRDWENILSIGAVFQDDELSPLRYSTRDIKPHIKTWKNAVNAWAEFLKIYDSVYNEIFTNPLKIIQDISLLLPDHFWFQFWLNMLYLEKNIPTRNFMPHGEITEFQAKLIYDLGPRIKEHFPEKCTEALQQISDISKRQRNDFLLRAENYESSKLARRILRIGLIPHPRSVSDETHTSGMADTVIRRGINDVVYR